ncbi:demethoxyubiquinone hydroxylase family protein [Saccharophagus sp. K07]|uniref:2-polyprenyl-3-methyl-6-methoxy-1,4-benzoquinone monooxygenase n=1 Tax=Saccharophagus sp. K07 TaxID=2283636 RepID=UPI001651D5B7|nr:2-polyprenyl-3-methyl-6-methoxy-1,4-benzoquinone monooxygenase [Saccharophagus sp. K07]MBC6903981.1 demethoxyubiquinone hydroxylase family protein [Saccharophagus sp. K07]
MPQTSQDKLSPLDRLICQFDRALQTLSPGAVPGYRPSPAAEIDDAELSAQEARHAAGLMRVNHTGEVCAQGLYQGQAATAKLSHIRKKMERAADEEIDHLAWCEERLAQLQSHPSKLNPLWYGLSFGIGATAGLISDKISLGFVAATEEQVGEHLKDHLKRLPPQDEKSRAILQTMLKEEEEHGNNALRAGGYKFPQPVKRLMRLTSKLMTSTSYRI